MTRCLSEEQNRLFRLVPNLKTRPQLDIQRPFLPEIEYLLISPVLAVNLQLQVKIPQDSS